MDNIIKYFKTHLNKDANNVTIEKIIPKKCDYCGYGELIIGCADLCELNFEDSDLDKAEEESDNHSDSDSDNSDEYKEQVHVDFAYHTGCMTYDSEMNYN